MGGKAILDFMEVFMDDILVPLAFFAMIAALFLVPDYFKSKDRARLHETLRIAYEKGQPVPPELIQALQSGNLATKDVNRSDKDLRAAVVLIGLIGGVIAVSQIMATNLMGRVESLSLGAQQHLVSRLIQSVETHLVLPSLPFGGEGLWMSAGLAGLALVFALTRAIEEY